MSWLKIDRKIQSHWIWKDPQKLKWWLDILLTVNYTDNKVLIGFDIFECKRGQSVLSLKSWGDKWGVSKDTVRNFFKLLEKDSMITLESLTKTTRITICNYELYQSDLHEEQTQSKRKANASSPNIRKKEEEQEIKEKNREAAKAATLKRISLFKESLFPYCLPKGKYTVDMVKDFFNYWSELNKDQTKMRWEIEKTFQAGNRLATWKKNEKPKFGEQPKSNIYKTTD